jgi:signal transduction histidine kinase
MPGSGAFLAASDQTSPVTNADLARHGLGFARLAADGHVIERVGAAGDWLPAPGASCFDAPLFAGLDEDMRALREGREPIVALPDIGMGAAGEKATITIGWDEAARCYSVAVAHAFGASETETMLVRERRERRLADEQAEAARKRANINEALYRDIVEAGADLVLRLTRDRRIAFANGRLLAFCGRDLGALISCDVATALPVREGEPWTTLDDRAEMSFEQRLADASGADVWIWWRAAWLGDDGGPAEYQAVGRDVTLLKKLQADIERAHEQARSALVMRERLKIAHDLHDTIVHALVAVVAQLRLVRKLGVHAPERVDAELAQAEAAAREGLERGREALGQVRFQRAGVEGLPAALARAAARFEERTGSAIDLRIAEGLDTIAGERAEILYRIVEEALRNVETHARASVVILSAREVGGELEIVVSDNGRGFDPTQGHPGHYGLKGMEEQARMIGGRLTMRSRPGEGAATIVNAPLRAGD